ncbi:Hypothetical_protein [Hexamita inflata]|uniref:Hypothetical_protein n=1 Tax=Hexamita inflata TaxID=28002 RepID=A0AA86PSY6_9EUKA|nr:Hypothetical protein HINF_LOCUS31841 [Hexamita inflata]
MRLRENRLFGLHQFLQHQLPSATQRANAYIQFYNHLEQAELNFRFWSWNFSSESRFAASTLLQNFITPLLGLLEGVGGSNLESSIWLHLVLNELEWSFLKLEFDDAVVCLINNVLQRLSLLSGNKYFIQNTIFTGSLERTEMYKVLA